MTIEERIRYLLQAAGRAEREGSARAARALRRMAAELRPAEFPVLPLALEGSRD